MRKKPVDRRDPVNRLLFLIIIEKTVKNSIDIVANKCYNVYIERR